MKNQKRQSTRTNACRWIFRGLAVFTAWLWLAAGFPLRAAETDDAAAAPDAYARWVKPWAERPLTSPALGGVELKALVTTVRGEVPLSVVTNMTPLERLEQSYRLKISTTEVAANGDCHSAFISNTETKSAPVRRLSSDELNRLDEELARLPDDHAQLPPPGGRVIVQTPENGAWRVRVYDGTQPPAEVKAVLDLLANPFDR